MSCQAEVVAFVHSLARIEARFDGRPFAKLVAREKHGRQWNVVAVEDAVRAAAMALRPGQRVRDERRKAEQTAARFSRLGEPE